MIYKLPNAVYLSQCVTGLLIIAIATQTRKSVLEKHVMKLALNIRV